MYFCHIFLPYTQRYQRTRLESVRLDRYVEYFPRQDLYSMAQYVPQEEHDLELLITYDVS
jgi:hypothetical protein